MITSTNQLNKQKEIHWLKKSLAHLKTPWKNLPEDWYAYEGFVYCITHLPTQKKYIGRKYFYQRKKNKVIKESDWEYYKSSSPIVLNLIQKEGLNNFEFKILSIHRTIAETNFAEIEEQFNRKVLHSFLPSGELEYFNENINSKYFRPKDYGTPEYEEKCKNISKALKEGFLSGRISHNPRKKKEKIKLEKECLICSKKFIPFGTQVYCSHECVQIARRKRDRERYKNKKELQKL